MEGSLAADFGSRLLGVVIAGGLSGGLACVAVGFLLEAIGRVSGFAGSGEGFRRFLAGGGWLWLPLWGAALGALRAVPWGPVRGLRLAAVALAVALAALPLIERPRVTDRPRTERLATARDKARAILRWSYRSPAGVESVLGLSRDPDPQVREQAILALGENLIVSDIEHSSPVHPSRFRDHPLRDRLRRRLSEALAADLVESVRAQAARALWKAPSTFGREPAAAETLAAILDRALEPRALERLTWLALDGAAGPRHPALERAAARFAAATNDPELRRAARAAAGARKSR